MDWLQAPRPTKLIHARVHTKVSRISSSHAPKSGFATKGDRAFAAMAPELPFTSRAIPLSFKMQLKIHVFKLAFN